jgi:hypothetical protein
LDYAMYATIIRVQTYAKQNIMLYLYKINSLL